MNDPRQPAPPLSRHMKLLTLDLGSTFFKAAVFDGQLGVRGTAAEAVHYRYGEGGHVEMDVSEAMRACRQAILGAMRAAGTDGSEIDAAGIASQAQTFTVTDREGRPRGPFLSWLDQRDTESVGTLTAHAALQDMRLHCSFGTWRPGLLISKLLHLQKNAHTSVRNSDRILKLPTFFVFRMTGRAVIDDNLAAMSGLYSLVAEDWWDAALEACGIGRVNLPQVIPIGGAAGRTTVQAAELGLPAGIPVVLAGNDQTAGAYGAELHAQPALLIGLGTAQICYVCAAQPPAPDADLIRGPYPGGRFYRMRADSCGGSTVNWATGVLAECADDRSFFRTAAQAAPGCRGLCFDAALPSGAGAWSRIGMHHGPPEFARSVLECLASRMAGMVRALRADLRGRPILVAGGGRMYPVWIEILSDALQQPLTVTDATPLHGAARLAREELLRAGKVA